MPYALSDLKKYFTFPEGGAYFNVAGQGPLSNPARDAVFKAITDKQFPSMMDQAYGFNHVNQLRQAVSKLVDCSTDQVALASSTTWGVNMIAQAYPWKVGDEVVAFDGQFPSNLAPWEILESRGVKLVRVPSPRAIADLALFEKHLTKNTRIASLEWVHFLSGDKIPIEEFCEVCHKKDILVVADVSQGLGAIPFSMKASGVDAVVCSGYKWLYSPYGTGFMSLNQKFLERLGCAYVNWLSLEVNWTDDLGLYNLHISPKAQRFDTSAQMGYLNLDGMTASVEWLNTLDIEHNFKSVTNLVNSLKEGMDKKYFSVLNDGSSGRQSLITTFECLKKNGRQVVAALKEAGYITSLRKGHVRVATSIYNDTDQIANVCRIANEAAQSS